MTQGLVLIESDEVNIIIIFTTLPKLCIARFINNRLPCSDIWKVYCSK